MHKYHVILGYDAGDLFYDSKKGKELLEQWRQVSQTACC